MKLLLQIDLNEMVFCTHMVLNENILSWKYFVFMNMIHLEFVHGQNENLKKINANSLTFGRCRHLSLRNIEWELEMIYSHSKILSLNRSTFLTWLSLCDSDRPNDVNEMT